MKKCMDCKHFHNNYPGKNKSKGMCYRYPESIKKFGADRACGEFGSDGSTGVLKRTEMMSELKSLGVKVNPKWKNDEMLKELEDARQKTEAVDGQGEAEEGEGPSV